MSFDGTKGVYLISPCRVALLLLMFPLPPFEKIVFLVYGLRRRAGVTLRKQRLFLLLSYCVVYSTENILWLLLKLLKSYDVP